MPNKRWLTLFHILSDMLLLFKIYNHEVIQPLNKVFYGVNRIALIK